MTNCILPDIPVDWSIEALPLSAVLSRKGSYVEFQLGRV